MSTTADDMLVCSRCGALVSTTLYFDMVHDRDACRENRGLVPCDDARCTAKEEPTTLEEYKAAYEHFRNHSRMGGCSHGN